MDGSYRRRWWAAGKAGASRRLGGRYAVLSRVVVPLLSGIVVFIVAGGFVMGAFLLSAAGAIAGAVIWALIIFAWSLLMAPAEMDEALRAQLSISQTAHETAARGLAELTARRLDRQRLGEFITEGNRLRSEAWAALTHPGLVANSPEVLEHGGKADAWAQRVVDYLDEVQPGSSDLFMNETPIGVQTRLSDMSPAAGSATGTTAGSRSLAS